MGFTFRNASAQPVRLCYLQEGQWRVIDDIPLLQTGDDVRYGQVYLTTDGRYRVVARDGSVLGEFTVTQDEQLVEWRDAPAQPPQKASACDAKTRAASDIREILVGLSLTVLVVFALAAALPLPSAAACLA